MNIKNLTIIILGLIILLLSIGSQKRIFILENQVSTMTDTLREQTLVNKGIIEVMKLREDPEYLKAVTRPKINKIKEK
jgi:hypothetical protein